MRERAVRVYERAAARRHEQAMLLELRVAEFFDRSGDAEAAKRHRAAAERHGRAAEDRYVRLSQPSEEELL